MTQFTSFVAVEEMTITEGGQPRRVDVPVEMPEGVSYEGVFGEADKKVSISGGVLNQSYSSHGQARKAEKAKSPGGAGGIGYGTGSSAAVIAPNAPPPPKPSPMPNVVIVDRVDIGKPVLSAAEQRQRQLISKLHPSVAVVVERLKNKQAKPAADEAEFVRAGKAEIQVWLTDKSDAALEQLRKLGFEVVLNPQSSKLVIGRLPIEKLEALAGLEIVRYVSPLSRK